MGVWETIGLTILVLAGAALDGVAIHGFIHAKGGFMARMTCGFEAVKEVILFPHRWLQERYERHVQAEVRIQILTREWSMGELVIIARRQPDEFNKAMKQALNLNTLGDTGHSAGETVAGWIHGLNALGKGFSEGLAKHGLQLDMPNIQAMNDEKAIGPHTEHNERHFDPECPRCAWLADDIVRPDSVVSFEDTRVQFDLRRQRIAEQERQGNLDPESHCTCVNERRGSSFHKRSCPSYGTISDGPLGLTNGQ